jgi:serine protease Do
MARLLRSARGAAAAAALLGAGFLAGRLAAPARPVTAEDAALAERALRRDATVRVVEAVSPAVVNVSTERLVMAGPRALGFGDDVFEEFFRDFAPRRRVRQTSLGSGVIVDPEGYVVTNAHVVARATAIEVSLHAEVAGARDFAASLVNISPENDLALLRIEAPAGGSGAAGRRAAATRFPVARLGRADDVAIGETVIALGNPFGLGSTVTRGVLSAKDRAVEGATDFLQTDAAINPGNSGGALVDLAGEVIGINTAIHARAHGIGFAIPVGRVRAVLLDLLDERELAGLWSGIAFDAADGAAIAAVAPGSPAEEAGLLAGERVVAVDGEPVLWAFAVKKRFANERRPALVLKVAGAGGTRDVSFRLAPAPQAPGEKVARERLGVRAKPVTHLLAERAGLPEASGVFVVRVESDGPAAKAGLLPGDVIVRLGVPQQGGGRGFVRYEIYDVRALEDLVAALARSRAGDRLLVFVLREGRELRGEIEPR